MDSREIIRRNLELSGPERIGFAYGRELSDDYCSASVEMGPRRTWVEDGIEYQEDIWGNIWHRVAAGSAKGEVSRPAIPDWSMLDGYRLPDLDRPALYGPVRTTFASSSGRYRLASLPGFPFAICRYLRKMEIYLQDLLLERANIDRLHGRVMDLLEGMIDRYASSGADGVFFCEDWGTQQALLVSPAMWRDIYKPMFRRLCGRIQDRGMHVIMHSCGYNWQILDDLAECGVSCFQFDQPALYGLDRLAAKLKSLGVCLQSPVDIQKVLPTGDRSLIEGEALRMIERFGRPTGGFIASRYGDLAGIGVKPEWDRWAYQAFVRHADLRSHRKE